MGLSPTNLGLSFIAGLLSTLSPCVLPLLPIVFGTASTSHRYGVPALISGLVVAFVTIGLFIASFGLALHIDQQIFRQTSAVILALFGIILISSLLQEKLAILTSSVSGFSNQFFEKFTFSGLKGQFFMGLLLGAVWSPCVGPTLGSASLLASQGKDLPTVMLFMMIFGIGTAVPLIGIGMMSRQALGLLRGRLMKAGKIGKVLLGISIFAIALLILTGTDHKVEAFLISITPSWLSDLTTRF